MLREPRHAEKAVEVRKDRKRSRFQILRLEERIAPKRGGNGGLHNPCDHGNHVGNPHCDVVV